MLTGVRRLNAPVVGVGFAALVAASLTGPALARLGPRLVIALAGVIIMAALIVTKARRLALALTVVAFASGSSTIFQLRDLAFYARFALLATLALICVFDARPVGRNPALARLGITGLGLAMIAMLSALWSVDPSVSFQRGSTLVILFASMVTIARRGWTDAVALRGDVRIVALVSGLIIVLGFTPLAAAFGSTVGGGRFRGLLENPNAVGIVVALTAPLLFGLLASGPSKAERKWIQFLLPAYLIAAVLSASRGGLVGIATGVVVYVMRSGSLTKVKRVIPLIAVVVIGIVTILVSSAPRDRVDFALGRFEERTGSGRVQAWGLSLELTAERPWVGYGFGVSEDVFGSAAQERLNQEFQGGNVHNGYLQALLEVGIVGMLFLAIMIVIIVNGSFGPGASDLRNGLTAAVIAGLVSQLAESGITAVGSVFAFLFWFSVVAALRLKTLEQQEQQLA